MANTPYGNTGETDMEAPYMRPASTGPKNMPPMKDGNAGDTGEPDDNGPGMHGNLDLGSANATPNDTLLLLGAHQPYKQK